jgi:hypothetical protein
MRSGGVKRTFIYLLRLEYSSREEAEAMKRIYFAGVFLFFHSTLKLYQDGGEQYDDVTRGEATTIII